MSHRDVRGRACQTWCSNSKVQDEDELKGAKENVSVAGAGGPRFMGQELKLVKEPWALGSYLNMIETYWGT